MYPVTFVGMMSSKTEGTYTVYAGNNWTQAVEQTRKYSSSSRLTWIETWINGMQHSNVEIDRNSTPARPNITATEE